MLYALPTLLVWIIFGRLRGAFATPLSCTEGGPDESGTCCDVFVDANGHVNIPSDVTTMPHSAFEDCEKLRTVSLNANLQKIPSEAFYGTRIESLDLSVATSLTEIGDDVFYEIENSLTSVNFAAPNLKKIGSWAFGYETGTFTDADLSGTSLTEIGEGAFYELPLASVTFPASLEILGAQAFEETALVGEIDLSALTSLTEAKGPVFMPSVTSLLVPCPGFNSTDLSGLAGINQTRVCDPPSAPPLALAPTTPPAEPPAAPLTEDAAEEAAILGQEGVAWGGRTTESAATATTNFTTIGFGVGAGLSAIFAVAMKLKSMSRSGPLAAKDEQKTSAAEAVPSAV